MFQTKHKTLITQSGSHLKNGASMLSRLSNECVSDWSTFTSDCTDAKIKNSAACISEEVQAAKLVRKARGASRTPYSINIKYWQQVNNQRQVSRA